MMLHIELGMNANAITSGANVQKTQRGHVVLQVEVERVQFVAHVPDLVDVSGNEVSRRAGHTKRNSAG